MRAATQNLERVMMPDDLIDAKELIREYYNNLEKKLERRRRDERIMRNTKIFYVMLVCSVSFFILFSYLIVMSCTEELDAAYADLNPEGSDLDLSDQSLVCDAVCDSLDSDTSLVQDEGGHCSCYRLAPLSYENIFSQMHIYPDLLGKTVLKLVDPVFSNYSIVLSDPGCTRLSLIHGDRNGEAYSWGELYVFKAYCGQEIYFNVMRAKRSDFGLNEPPELVVGTSIGDKQQKYQKHYRLFVARGEKRNVVFNASRSHDPERGSLNISFHPAGNDGLSYVINKSIGLELDLSMEGEKVFVFTAVDDEGHDDTGNVTIDIVRWELDNERTVYLIYGGIIASILLFVGMVQFNKFKNLYLMDQMDKGMKHLVSAIFFGIMLNFCVINITLRLVFLPFEVSRSVGADSFMPATDVGDPMTSFWLKYIWVLILAGITYLALKRLKIDIPASIKRLIRRFM